MVPVVCVFDVQDVANSVFRYQCSKDSTSTQIHEVFENALRFKQRELSSQRCPVVFLDEAGLPPERTESLKAMHYWIDQNEVFCCVLANKPLDAAKRNRCLQVFRDEADVDDLKILASKCLNVSLEDPSSLSMVNTFCAAFREISRDQDKGHCLTKSRETQKCEQIWFLKQSLCCDFLCSTGNWTFFGKPLLCFFLRDSDFLSVFEANPGLNRFRAMLKGRMHRRRLVVELWSVLEEAHFASSIFGIFIISSGPSCSGCIKITWTTCFFFCFILDDFSNFADVFISVFVVEFDSVCSFQ